ncbi:curli-like amyloid fiber formation chaperone CsgH [Hymenobacter aerophilus]|uniref:curli-like amyloid fiber formation chaperone CsgH n=1 Tax=Hymenobacter aerophilus TaxID=119644 RepID=UPI000369EFC4|nr:curli-like amyloid fiber formation chaperone CsgH [Hymenobacter aerophilus]
MHIVLLFLASAGALLGVSQTTSGPPCRAWLQATPRGSLLEVTGNCSSLAASTGHYRYEMSLERLSAGGRSTSQQGGEFDLAAGQSVVLASTQVNIDGKSTYVGHLRVFDAHNVLLAQDSVRHTPGN